MLHETSTTSSNFQGQGSATAGPSQVSAEARREMKEWLFPRLSQSKDFLFIEQDESLQRTLQGGKFLHIMPPSQERFERELPNPTLPPELAKHIADAFEARIATASRPNMFCYSCRHPLGTRPPSGPRGEPSTVIYIRGARYTHGRCNPVWWELANGQRLLSCTHAHLQFTWAVVGSLVHSMVTGARIECDCGNDPLHTLYAYFLDNLDIGREAAVDLPHAMGIVQLLRWKPTALVQEASGGKIAKVAGNMLGSGKVEIRYRTDAGTAAEKYTWVPIDSLPIPRGVRGRCPKCGEVQRLE